MTCVDVSGCAAPEDMATHGTPLRQLLARGCSKITYLDFDSDIEELDISGCSALPSILYYGDSKTLRILNANGCAALEHISFDYNQLVSLDVRGCASLEDLSCIGNQLTEQSRCSLIGFDAAGFLQFGDSIQTVIFHNLENVLLNALILGLLGGGLLLGGVLASEQLDFVVDKLNLGGGQAVVSLNLLEHLTLGHLLGLFHSIISFLGG
jgi:hypothetical protein